MEPATWENCRADFDRAYVDLLVPDTGSAVWQEFWTALRSGPFEVLGLKGYDSIPSPQSVAWIFSKQQLERRMILAYVTSGAITPFCYFNFEGGDGDYPKLHIDCLEMVSAETFESVLAVMRFLAGALGLSVLAVGEGDRPQDAFIRVSPAGQSMFLPSGSGRPAGPPTAERLFERGSPSGQATHRGRVHVRFPDRGDFLQDVQGACGVERWGDGIEWFGMEIECCGCGHEVNPWARGTRAIGDDDTVVVEGATALPRTMPPDELLSLEPRAVIDRHGVKPGWCGARQRGTRLTTRLGCLASQVDGRHRRRGASRNFGARGHALVRLRWLLDRAARPGQFAALAGSDVSLLLIN